MENNSKAVVSFTRKYLLVSQVGSYYEGRHWWHIRPDSVSQKSYAGNGLLWWDLETSTSQTSRPPTAQFIWYSEDIPMRSMQWWMAATPMIRKTTGDTAGHSSSIFCYVAKIAVALRALLRLTRNRAVSSCHRSSSVGNFSDLDETDLWKFILAETKDNGKVTRKKWSSNSVTRANQITQQQEQVVSLQTAKSQYLKFLAMRVRWHLSMWSRDAPREWYRVRNNNMVKWWMISGKAPEPVGFWAWPRIPL